MADWWWSWLLTAVGVTGFILAGKKIWWAWYINIACQFLWVSYAIITEQYGFIVASVIYFIVFSRNAYNWTREFLDPHHGFDLDQNRIAMSIPLLFWECDNEECWRYLFSSLADVDNEEGRSAEGCPGCGIHSTVRFGAGYLND